MRMWAVLVATSCWWACATAPISAEEPPEPKPLAATEGTSPEELDTWVRDLDADRFVVREIATQKLAAAGAGAVAPVLRSLEGASLEASMRAIVVLREIAKSADPEASEIAENALRKVAATESSSAVRARESLALLENDREDQAIKALRSLGATIQRWSFLQEESPDLWVSIDDQWRGTETDFLYLRRIKRARRLDLVGAKITNQTLQCLRYVPELNILTLRECAITDAGMQAMRDLNSLEVLVVFFSPLTDHSLKQLEELKQLRELYVYGTQMTEQGVQPLAQKLAVVDRRNGGLLGVSGGRGDLEQTPCVLQNLQPDSAAAQAGCEPDDIVVKIGDNRIRHFKDLQASISKYRAGDVVKLEIVRGLELEPQLVHRADVPLGIQCEPAAVGVRVTKVELDSPADRTGIQVGDLILRFDGEAVASDSELKKTYESSAVGAIEIALLRNSQTLTKEVTLQKWSQLPPSVVERFRR